MRRRDFNSMLCGAALLGAAWPCRAGAQDAAASGEDEAGMAVSTMTVYDHGKTTALDIDTRESRHVAAECSRLLQNATGVLRLAVTPQLIDDLKRGEYCLELVSMAPQTMQMAKLQDVSVTFTRMLVPLSGSFASNVSTVFLATADTYDQVPYRNNASIAAMRSYIETMIKQTQGQGYHYSPF